MNYRHGFHAGNFADVLKHVVLSRIIVHLATKPAAFRVIDTHAGEGLYDLTGDEARRGGEWQGGIGRLVEAARSPRQSGPLTPDMIALLTPYLHAVRARNTSEALRFYPGSPLLALTLMRPQDRLVLCEARPDAASALDRHLRAERRARIAPLDGWAAPAALLPPPERRGLLLIDPAFEEGGEHARLGDALVSAWRKWPSGIFVGWYPVKRLRDPQAVFAALDAAGVPKMLRVELQIDAIGADGPLGAAGLAIINPPWTLADELKKLLPALITILHRSSASAHRLELVGGEI